MQRYNQRMIEQLKTRQQQEKNRLPKIQRSEGKTRMVMYKKSLRINSAGSHTEHRDKIKQVTVRPMLHMLAICLVDSAGDFSKDAKIALNFYVNNLLHVITFILVF